MNGAIKSFAFFAVIFLIAVTIGCDNDGSGGSSQDTQALTEHDFGADPSLSADPENHVIVKFLEHPDSEGHENDTGETGNDVIPITYKRDLNHTYCWDDDDEDSEHFMILLDSDDVEILSLGANEDCVTAFITAGSYTMIIHHDAWIETIHTIFIVPESGLVANNKDSIPEGMFSRAGRLLSDMLEKLDNSITQTTNAQTPVGKNVKTLLITNSCVGCDLTGANLSGANLSHADLRGAVLNGVDLTGAFLFEALLIKSSLTDANLTQAILIGADLSGTTWCDGSRCPTGSTGTCETGARFTDNCDGTISDADTGLMWEKKVDGPAGSCLDDDKLHSVEATCNWHDATSDAPGGWLYKLNNRCHREPLVECTEGGDLACVKASVGGPCGFAGHRNWRVPEVASSGGMAELKTILDCVKFTSPCINPLFGRTASDWYWSATISGSGANDIPITAVVVFFGFESTIFPTNTGTQAVNHRLPIRAVRTRPGGQPIPLF